ncbi:hypothetical protein [Haloferax sp. DFSO52]|uniref:hypothetical protein n=1 Tax=Haloferax sp. DFSO52 TaxID=3388505 RepID=UPI003A88847D
MSNEPSERRDREVATSTFEDWVAQKAAERDSSRERVLEQLLDSYWTMEQITQMVGGRDASVPFPVERPANTTRDADSEQTDGAVTEFTNSELRDSIETLQENLETASRHRAELVDEVQSLAGRLDEVEATQESVDELAETVREIQTSLESEQARLDDRIDDEFDNLQTILDYLVKTGDNLDAKITQTQIQFRAEIRELRAARDRLRHITEDARELGTYTAGCEQCGTAIDLALLTEPDCPNCERALTGVEAETNWLVLTSYTATTQTHATDSPPREGEREHSRETEAHSTEATTPETADGTEPTAEAAQSTPSESQSEGDDSTETTPGTSPDETEFQWLT